MFFNKPPLSLVFAILLVAGLVFAATPETAAVTPLLSVTDADKTTSGIQVYGIRAESVSFTLTITFQDANDAKTPVTGFDKSDIVLNAADSSNTIVPLGATASAVSANANGSVYTAKITVIGNINTVLIGVPQGAANTIGRLVDGSVVGNDPTDAAVNLVVSIVRSAAPPLTIHIREYRYQRQSPLYRDLNLNKSNHTHAWRH